MVKVSMIIPVKNSAGMLKKCLTSIRSLDFPMDALEIIIVDGGSTDGSIEVAEKFGCKVVFEDKSVIRYATDFSVKTMRLWGAR